MLWLHALLCTATTNDECSRVYGQRGRRTITFPEIPCRPPPSPPPTADPSFWVACSSTTKAHLTPAAEARMPDGFPYTVPVGAASALPRSTANTLLTLVRITAGCEATAVARSYADHPWDATSTSAAVSVSCSGSTCTIKVEAGSAAYAGFRVDAVLQDAPSASAAASRLLIQGSFGPTRER